MKKNEMMISVLVFTTFFIVGCLKVGNERATSGNSAKKISNTINISEEKNIRSMVSSLHTNYNIRFFVLRTNPFAYKLKVDGNVNINNFIEDLERLELSGERYLGILGPLAQKTSFYRKLREKLKAIRNFLQNYDRDNSYFLPQDGKRCPRISGDYKKIGPDGNELIISIKSRGCYEFEVSRSSKNRGPIIKLEDDQNCLRGDAYNLCSSGRKLSSGQIEFNFFEIWEEQNCSKENWLRVDAKGETLISTVRQICQGTEATIFEDNFIKVMN